MRIKDGIKLDYKDVLIVPTRSNLSSRKDVNLIRKFKIRNNEFEGVPIISSNMATGNFNMLKSLSDDFIFTAIAKHHNDKWNDYLNTEVLKNILDFGFYTIGIKPEEFFKLEEFSNKLENKKLLKICIDVANGYSQKFIEHCKKIREKFPDNVIMAGNICTPEIAQELVLSGVDILKCNIGAGLFCETRLKTGVGFPQLSMIEEVSSVCHGLNAYICADGGISSPGDICKAFAANADFVMVGSLFSGTDECDGEIISRYFFNGEYKKVDDNFEKIIEEKKYKLFYGMSSDYAQEKHFEGIKDYRTSEGLVKEVEYKGSVKKTVKDILGGLRSCCAYIGASEIKKMGKCATFVRVNRQHEKF